MTDPTDTAPNPGKDQIPGSAASREYDLGDILSVTTDRLVSPRHVDGLYDLLGFMVGEPVWTHQLPRASRECKPDLLKQHPQLRQVVAPEWEFGPEDDANCSERRRHDTAKGR